MAPNVTVSFWAPGDINGTPLLTITDEDEFFKGLRLQPDLYSVGGWELTLARNIGFQLFDSGAVQPEVFVRFLVHAWSDETYYYGGVLSKRQQDVVHRDEAGAEEFVFGGPGPKQYMDRYRLGIEQLTGSGWNLDLENGVWVWNETANAGRVLNRLIAEDAAADDPALPALTQTFDATDDSNGSPWTDTIATDGTFELPIGNSLLQTIWDLEDLADLFTTIDLGTVSAPAYVLEAWETFGEDVTGSAFGAGVGLFREGVNIANDSLQVTGVSLRKATHVIVGGKDGVWNTAVRPAWSPGDYVKWAIISYPRSSSPTILEKAGIRWLKRQDNGSEELTIEYVPGDSEATGYYFPAPDGVLWPWNTVSVDTVADGSTHSPLDYNNSPFLLTGLELELGPAGDDTSGDKRAKSWDCKVKLNHERGGNAQSPNQGSAGTGDTPCKCGPHTHPGGGGACESPPACEDAVPEGLTTLQDSEEGDWGSTVTTGACWSSVPHREIGGSGQVGPVVSVAPGDIIRGAVNFREETGNDTWENVTNYNYRALLRFSDSGGAPPANLDFEIVNQRYHATGCIDVTHSTTQEVPSGYDQAQIVILSRLGGYRFNAVISEVAPGSEPDNDPYCIDEDVPTDSPYCLPSDAIQYLIDHHSHNQAVVEDVFTNETDPDLRLHPVGDGTTEWTTNNLDDLTDVDAPSPADGDALIWNNGAGEWQAAAPTPGLGSWTTYTPTLTGSVTNPTLGSSTVTGRYKLLDSKTVIVQVNMAVTTGGAWNAGSGAWMFSLPAGMTAATRKQVGSGHVADAGTTHYVCTPSVPSGGTVITETYVADTAGAKVLTHNVPVTWATGDQIELSLLLEIQ
jgi:hypothetical protein